MEQPRERAALPKPLSKLLRKLLRKPPGLDP